MNARSLSLILALILGAASGSAQTAFDLLEEGLYAEMTVGDLDAAIALYEQVAAQTDADADLRAEALYRLAVAQDKSGDRLAAGQSFKKLIEQFPDAKQAAKAKKQLQTTLALETEPWIDGEILRYDVRLPGGMSIGTVITKISSATVGSEDVWRLEVFRFFGAGQYGVSRIEARKKDFQPLHGFFKLIPFGERNATYRATADGTVIDLAITAPSGEQRSVSMDAKSGAYDNDQVLYLLRGFPLHQGYKVSVPLVGLQPPVLDLALEVAATETLDVPAGRFETFKVENSIAQPMWFSTDAKRYPVRMEFGGVIAELASIGQIDAEQPLTHQNAKLGFSLTVPSGWEIYDHPVDQPGVAALQLLDPEADLLSGMQVFKRSEVGLDTPRAVAEKDIATLKKIYSGYEVRDDSWHEQSVDGRPAVSFLADFTKDGQALVDTRTYALGDDLGVFFTFAVAPDQLLEVQPTLESILDSFSIP